MGRQMINIAREGGIATHVNRFFEDQNSAMRFTDIMRLKNMRVGKRKLSMQRQADELGVSRGALIKWHKLIDSKDKRADSTRIRQGQDIRESSRSSTEQGAVDKSR